MKEKIFDKMKEYGWNLGANSYEDFNKVYDYHNTRFNKEWEQLEEKENRTELEELRVEDLRFITDFLRAIDDIDNLKIVGNARIDLSNSHNIPLSLSYLTYGNVGQLETNIRKCKMSGSDICDLLNNSKEMIYEDWQVELDTDNIIILKGKDDNSVGYLQISTLK